MTKAVSNIDAQFFQCTTAQVSRARKLCETLALQMDSPAQLALLKTIYGELLGVGANIVKQQNKRSQRKNTNVVSNTDTRFFEDTTAQVSRGRELCQALALQMDCPEQLALLKTIYEELLGIRTNIINQRNRMRARPRSQRPRSDNHGATDATILPQQPQREKHSR